MFLTPHCSLLVITWCVVNDDGQVFGYFVGFVFEFGAYFFIDIETKGGFQHRFFNDVANAGVLFHNFGNKCRQLVWVTNNVAVAEMTVIIGLNV